MKEKKIKLDETKLEKFNPTVAKLTAMVKKTENLKVVDLKDKAKIEIVRKARIELKNTRVDITKYAKDLREDANKFSSDVIAKEKELISIIKPEEDRLESIEDEAEKLAIREERMEKLPVRKERLQAIKHIEMPTDEEILDMDATQFESAINFHTAKSSEIELADMRAEQKKKDDETAEERRKLDEDRLANEKEKQKLENEKNARDREEKAREEEREKLKKEQEEKERKEKEEKDRVEKIELYRNWRAQFGWTEETRGEFKEEKVGDTIVLYKKLDTFHLK